MGGFKLYFRWLLVCNFGNIDDFGGWQNNKKIKTNENVLFRTLYLQQNYTRKKKKKKKKEKSLKKNIYVPQTMTEIINTKNNIYR